MGYYLNSENLRDGNKAFDLVKQYGAGRVRS
jgi:hypothetical protein